MSAPTFRGPAPGRGPVMVFAPGGGRAPLVPEQFHAALCGFTTVTLHPQDPRLGQCSGCRLWRVVPVHQIGARR